MPKAFSVRLLNSSESKGEQALNLLIFFQKPLGYLSEILDDILENLTRATRKK